jgi:DNA-binding XRE family transcriptional regulator
MEEKGTIQPPKSLNPTMNTYLKQNIIFLRKKAGNTQGEIAELLDLNKSTYQAYEEGRATPPIEIVLKLAELYCVTMEELLTSDIESGREQKPKPAEELYSKFITSPQNVKLAVKALLNLKN